VNSAAAVEAAGIVTRIAYRFEVMARARELLRPEVVLPEKIRRIRALLDERCCASIESLLVQFELAQFREPLTDPAVQSATNDLNPLIDDLTAAGTREYEQWSPETQNAFFAQLESYRRLAILLGGLSAELAKLLPP
jgi:hypothetical protein